MKRIARTWFPLELIKNLLRLPFRPGPVEESVNMGGPDALAQVDARDDGVVETIPDNLATFWHHTTWRSIPTATCTSPR